MNLCLDNYKIESAHIEHIAFSEECAMAVVWLVESFQQARPRLVFSLSGSVAVRTFASVASMRRVLTMEGGIAADLPGLVVIDGRCDQEVGTIMADAVETSNALCGYAGSVIPCWIVSDSGAETDSEIRTDFVSICPTNELLTRTLAFKIENGRAGLGVDTFVTGFGDALMRADSRAVSCRICGESEILTVTEFRLLMFLANSTGCVIDRGQLVKKIWGDIAVSSRNLDAHISRLRSRISFVGLAIEAVYGQGYRLSAVSKCEADSGRISAPRGAPIQVDRPAPSMKQVRCHSGI